MKFNVLLAVTCFAGSVGPAFGATSVSYTATADPNVAPDGVDANGNAADVWTLTHSGGGTAPDNYGSFLGNSANNGGGSGAGAGTSAWGIYANANYTNATGDNEVDIGHTFDGGALTAGQSVSLDLDGGYVNTGASYGIRLYGASGFVLAFTFTGGDSVFKYYDATPGGHSSNVGYTADGLNFKYIQTGDTTYEVVVTEGSNVVSDFTGSVSGDATFIQVYNDSAGQGANYDVFANDLTVVPEPATYLAGIGGVAALALHGRRRHKVSA